MKPSGPPSWLAPLSDITMISVLSRTPAVSRKPISRARCRSAWSSMPAKADCRREHALFVVAVLLPRLHAVIARRKLCVVRHKPHRLLPREPLLALDVPAMGEQSVITSDDVAWRLV